jgi:HAD superfamily hydrolase (TIGR01490 family)
MAQKFAVFDIDGTVIRWQLYHSIVSELASRGKLSPGAEQTIRDARMTWKQRAHSESFREYEHVLIHAYLDALASLKVTDYMQAVDTVFAEYKDQVYTYTRDLIKSLKQSGYLLFAISGSQQEIITKLADYYGFDDAVGAQLKQHNGYFTGELETPALGKQKSLDELLARHDITKEGSIAVGDSESDEALLAAVENPIAFNPSAGLFAIAKDRGWKIVVERKNVIYELESRDGSYVLA